MINDGCGGSESDILQLWSTLKISFRLDLLQMVSNVDAIQDESFVLVKFLHQWLWLLRSVKDLLNLRIVYIYFDGLMLMNTVIRVHPCQC